MDHGAEKRLNGIHSGKTMVKKWRKDTKAILKEKQEKYNNLKQSAIESDDWNLRDEKIRAKRDLKMFKEESARDEEYHRTSPYGAAAAKAGKNAPLQYLAAKKAGEKKKNLKVIESVDTLHPAVKDVARRAYKKKLAKKGK